MTLQHEDDTGSLQSISGRRYRHINLTHRASMSKTHTLTVHCGYHILMRIAMPRFSYKTRIIDQVSAAFLNMFTAFLKGTRRKPKHILDIHIQLDKSDIPLS